MTTDHRTKGHYAIPRHFRMRTDLFSDADFAPLLEDEAQRARTL